MPGVLFQRSCLLLFFFFVALTKQDLLAEELLSLGTGAFLTLRAALCYCYPFVLNLKTQDANPGSW